MRDGDNGSCRVGVLELLIIQPTPFCNLDCDYCYLPNRQITQRITTDILRRIFQRAFDSTLVAGEFTVVWHAGEPLVMPISFYEKALAIIQEENGRGVQVHHSFQTNATLLTPAWCQFFKKHGLGLGVSVDGPAFLHDRHRRTRKGNGSWLKVTEGLRLLQRHGVPFHVITVLTAESLDYPDEIFDFYEEFGVRQVCFNVEEIEGPHVTSSLSFSGAEGRYMRFLDRFYELVQTADEPYYVREFSLAIAALQHIKSLGTTGMRGPQQTTPFGIISIDCYGNFSTFSPELLGLRNERYGNFVFGNVSQDAFAAVVNSPSYKAAAEDIAAGVARCAATCEYFPYCGRGAPVNKFFENGSFDSTETMFCRFTQQLPMDLVLRKLTLSRKTEIVR